MDNTAPAPERAAQQAPSAELPTGWVEVQEELADASGLALLLVEGRQPPSLAVSNNNSICQAFQSSPTHAHLCQTDCGEAFFRAGAAGGPVQYRCHAGLHCFTMPVPVGKEKPLAVIGGRCFVRVADYRALAERIRAGDLADLLSADLFSNVIFGAQQDLEELAARVAESAEEFARRGDKSVAASRAGTKAAPSSATTAATETQRSAADVTAQTAPESDGPQATDSPSASSNAPASSASADDNEPAVTIQTTSQKGLAPGGSLEDACRKAVRALAEENGFESLTLLLRHDDSFFPAYAPGV